MTISWNLRRKTYTAAQPINVIAMSEFWEKGTDAEVISMITAARNGQYQLSDYWNIGDKRTITIGEISGVGGASTIASREVDIVITEFGGKQLQDGTTCLFQWDFNVAVGNYPMRTTETNSGGYESSLIAPWLDDTFFAALPSWLQSLSKSFYTNTSAGSGSRTINKKVHKLGIRTETEVFGTSKNSPAEGKVNTHISYYKTEENRLKVGGGYWLATVYNESGDSYGNARNMCYVSSSSYWPSNCTADSRANVAPYGCI